MVDGQEQVAAQNGDVHDQHTSPGDELLLGHMGHLDVHGVVHVDKRVEECW